MYWVSFIIGLIVVISSIFLIRNEFNRAVNTQTQMLEHSKLYSGEDLFGLLEDLQLSINNMNKAFYDIVNDLEGNISVHEKEIKLLTERIDKFSLELKKLDHKSNEQVIALSPQANLGKMLTNKNQIPSQSKPISNDNHNDYSEDSNLLFDKVKHLRSQGIPLPQIAKELGVGLGEIQLLLSLKK